MLSLTGFVEWTSLALRRFFIGTPLGTRGWGGRSEAGEQIDENAALSISTAWACVNLVAGTIGSLPIAPYRRDAASGHLAVARDHWSYRLLAVSPNAEQTPLDFWEGGLASIELKGNMLADLERADDGRVLAMTPVPWGMVNVRRQEGQLVYRWGAEQRTADQVLHIRGFGGAAEGGLSTLAYARNTFGLARAAERAAGTTFANGLRPSGVLKSAGWLKPEQRAELEGALVEKFAGAANAGRPMLLEGGTDWQALTMNPEDAQLLESRKLSIEDICRFFGIPPFMIGHTEKTTSWGTGLEQQVLGFQKFSLRRRLVRVEQALSKQILTPADIAAGIVIKIDLDELLRGDSAARAAFYQLMVGIGAMTINEVRQRENMLPVPGGDVPRTQMQNVSINATLGGAAAIEKN